MKPTKNKLAELETIISKIPIQVCSVTVLPEFCVSWNEVASTVRSNRLPMDSSSVAKVLCRHAAKSLPQDELEDIIGRLRLKLVVTQSRTWHVLHLHKPTIEEPVADLLRILPHRVLTALRRGKHGGMTPEVQSVMHGDLMYLSVQFVSDTKEGSILYLATPPGQPVALVSSASGAKVLKACVEGLGYSAYENAQLHGKHIESLLRVSDPGWTCRAEQLTAQPQYQPVPTVLHNGIDYTHRKYDQMYVENVIGPNPPLLTDLHISTTRNFFDASLLNKMVNLKFSLKSDDVSKSLRDWVAKGAIAPTSDFFKIFHEIKSNNIVYNRDSDTD